MNTEAKYEGDKTTERFVCEEHDFVYHNYAFRVLNAYYFYTTLVGEFWFIYASIYIRIRSPSV